MGIELVRMKIFILTLCFSNADKSCDDWIGEAKGTCHSWCDYVYPDPAGQKVCDDFCIYDYHKDMCEICKDQNECDNLCFEECSYDKAQCHYKCENDNACDQRCVRDVHECNARC